MNVKYLSALLVTGTVALGTTPAIADSSDTPQLSFSCQVNQGVPTTVAQLEGSEKTQPIFHWKQEALVTQSADTPQQLCNSVTAKLADYSAQGYELSSINFIGRQQADLPAICLNTIPNSKECSKVLTTLSPVKGTPDDLVAADVVTAILDPSLQQNKSEFKDRGVQATSYQVNFWELLGLGLGKSENKFNLR